MTLLAVQPTKSIPQTRKPASQADLAGKALLIRLAELPTGHPDRDRIRTRAIESHLALANHLARRFRDRGEPLDDLVQVANLGLIKAVDGFDPDRKVEFVSYALPTIVGELKRHFRDKGWSVRVPRRLQELKMLIGKATGPLTQQLRRTPTVAELAQHLHITEEEVIEGIDCANAYQTLSLHAPSGDENAPDVADSLGDVDPEMMTVEDRETLRPALAQLPERERTIVGLRFFHGLTQSQIAARMGISQMHVSRLLARSLVQLRAGFRATA